MSYRDRDQEFASVPPNPADIRPAVNGHRDRLDEATGAGTPGQPATKSPSSFTWAPLASADFFAADYRPNWLVENAIVESQPCILGGPQKSLKTSIALDFAISIATGTPALGHFAVNRARKVAIISGESGPFALQSIGRRICKVKGIDNPAMLGDMISWQFRLPQLSNVGDLAALKDGIQRDRPEVVIIDPLYLSLLAGSEKRAENLFDTGPLLMKAAQVCEEAGATPILLHHAPKPVARSREPMELTDLAFSGTAEFARQWLLVNRREAYQPGSGQHNLWLVVGGSVGHNGLYAVDIDEGQLGTDFGGRHWTESVESGTDAKQSQTDEKQAAKKESALRRDNEDDLAVMRSIDNDGGRATFSRVRAMSGVQGDRLTRALERLAGAGIIAPVAVEYESGNGAKKSAKGFKRIGEKGNGGYGGLTADNSSAPPSNGTAGGYVCPVGTHNRRPSVLPSESAVEKEGGEYPPSPPLFDPTAGPYREGL